MKTWISMLLILASVSLFGCDERRAKEQLNSTMNSWIGRDINEFVRKYGTPTTTLTLPNGNTKSIPTTRIENRRLSSRSL
jgi:methyl coenzyme M reductase subunit C-like uncharacterized protein (methanogenesis marker protein 7)